MIINWLSQCSSVKPPFWEVAETARWLAHANLWGTLSTTSVHLNGQAWGQPKSFVDGSNENSTGVLYFYDSDMDTSIQDTTANPKVSFSVSLAEYGTYCNVEALDPEDPRCARVVFSGKFVEVTDPLELAFATDALFQRHPAMEDWPADHSWKVHKIEPSAEIWLIDIYGGGITIFSHIFQNLHYQFTFILTVLFQRRSWICRSTMRLTCHKFQDNEYEISNNAMFLLCVKNRRYDVVLMVLYDVNEVTEN